MKRKYLSALLMGTLVVASTSTFTSCKDYDDDISNLQSQIDKAGLQSDIDALKTQLQDAASTASAAKTTAESALAKANDAAVKADVDKAIAAVKATADKAATDVAQAISDAANAQAAADKAQGSADDANKAANNAAEAAKKAQETADQAVKDAASAAAAALAAQNTANAAATQADFEKALERIGKLETSQITADQLDQKLSDLRDELLGTEGDKETIGSLSAKVNAYKGAVEELYSAVTGVELVETYSGQNGQGLNLGHNGSELSLDMLHGLVAESSIFGDETADKADPTIAYEKGQDVKDESSIIVRVNPVNADLTKGAKIILLNSKGESLEDIVEVGTPSKFDKLITTRAAASVNTGLWKLPVSVAKGVSEEDFKKAVTTEDGNAILYAVAVNNTVDSKAEAAADRYVVSSYDVKPTYTNFVADNDFTFEVNGTSIDDIHNRWNGTNVVGENLKDKNSNAELAWNNEGPATAPVTKTEGNVKKNVQNANRDVRINKPLLQVEAGKEFTISKLAAAIKVGVADYYYVVLDKANAVESSPSELNAWNSYDIEGLGKTVKASEDLKLKINSKSANGDVIGFRVYAVNRDGKLLDPDGKAFYVVVGNAITGNIVGNFDAAKGITDKKEFKAVADVNYTGWTIDTEASKDALPFLEEGKVPTFTPVYYKKDGKTVTDLANAELIAFTVDHPEWIADDASVVLKNVIKSSNDGNAYEVGTVKAMYTKVLPKSFPADITFRPKQETVEGSGNFKAYMKPVSDYIVAAAAKNEGTVDLDNIFYNLDQHVSFTVKDAAKNGDKLEDVTSDPDHVLTIAKDMIDSKTAHAITAAYNYGLISCQYNDKTKTWKSKDWIRTSDKSMNVTFACWESDNSYNWVKATAETKDANGTVIFAMNATEPQLVWSAEGTSATVAGKYINTVNTYNNTYFGGKLDAVIGTKKFLKIKDNAAHLYYGAQEDPYFKAVVDANGNITFTQNGVQVENAPTADHVETLKFTVLDAFYHETEVKLNVLIKRPASSAAARRK